MGSEAPDGHTSFFHLADIEIVDQVCQGTACFVARHQDPARWTVAEGSSPRVYCLGRCYAAPAAATDTTRPRIAVDADEPVLLGRVVAGSAPTFDAYRADGGYATLERTVGMAPRDVVAEVEASKLRGRGGAAFATAVKWRAAAEQTADHKYVVCNADEGDPGAFSDRILLEADPHAVLEGLAIAGFAVGAERGLVYVRKEYPEARAAMARAIAEARARGVLGDSLAGDGPPFDVEIIAGEGSYVCGEETALLNALEGRRPEVRARPPYPVERGLFDRPTVVNNVETLASVPWILRHGGDAYAAMGAAESRGTKLVSLSSLFRRPGLYEVELGVTVREIVERLGGGLEDGHLRGVLVGGPLAGVLPERLLDTPFEFEALRAVGAEVGHGGIVALDERTTATELMHHVFRFGAYESCGKCTPCREGAASIERRFEPTAAEAPSAEPPDEWDGLVSVLAGTSLCGHGTGLAAFARSMMQHFGDELA
ncbi:MAG: complex I 51 kDa subunit family protein [Acidimicrobiia bacterium]